MRGWRWLVVLGAAASPAACGPSTVTIGVEDGSVGPGDATVGDSSPGDGGADGPGHVACPSVAPPAGAPCPEPGQECEYGSSATPACNRLGHCTASGWLYGGTVCDAGCATSCPTAVCPAGYPVGPSPSSALACSASGLVCSYADGTCACSLAATATAAHPDAGVHWTCFPAQAGCPVLRPAIGTACSSAAPAMKCNYGACSGGVELSCTSGFWQLATPVCP